jgi:hypothetical protein
MFGSGDISGGEIAEQESVPRSGSDGQLESGHRPFRLAEKQLQDGTPSQCLWRSLLPRLGFDPPRDPEELFE